MQRLLCVAFLLFAYASGVGAQRLVRIVSYNVENLFDCNDDTLKDDAAFLPDGEYHWTRSRYWRKLDDVGQTIVGVGGDAGLPVLVGLCEVENDTVMHDLTRRSALRTANYEYVMTESQDARGVDVALLFQPALFRLNHWHPVRIPSAENGFSPTRDLLYACGQLLSGDTLHIVVCHLPSKSRNGRSSKLHRDLAVQTLRAVVDSLQMVDAKAKLLVMGDFNASFGERIFKQLMPPLHETLPTKRSELMRPVGTYFYQKQWSYLDHILVSDGLLDWQTSLNNPLRAHDSRLSFLLNEQGTPNRTFRGPVYNGGVSDHLPLYLDLWLP